MLVDISHEKKQSLKLCLICLVHKEQNYEKFQQKLLSIPKVLNFTLEILDVMSDLSFFILFFFFLKPTPDFRLHYLVIMFKCLVEEGC